ncbi:MAG: thiamine-phosphate kinase [Chromatiaceae bacterium]
MSEFDLIRDYFCHVGAARRDVALGVGDDCALLRVPEGFDLAVSIDTLTAGVHFLPDGDPESIGHKVLAVGLSDLAAMGAEPAWATLALTLPTADRGWIGAFCLGFARLAKRHGVQLVGGDTTRGALSVTVQVHGLVPVGTGVQRRGARPGDRIWVTGTVGDAGLALRRLGAGEPVSPFLRERLDRPLPRVTAGLSLRGLASAMIDVSDGLAADLGHILEASCVGAEVELPALPLSPEAAGYLDNRGDWTLPLASGDDYELCFTVPPDRCGAVDRLAERSGCRLSAIGVITEKPGLRCVQADGSDWGPACTGYDHFADGG